MMRISILLGAIVASCTSMTPAVASDAIVPAMVAMGAFNPPAKFPDRGRAAVVDAANVLPDDAERALNQRIVSWVKTSGHQLVVATVPTLGGADIKDYGYRLGRTWGLGDASKNDGVILLLAPNERKVRIEVGYGLEPVLTDALTSGIIRDEIVPQLRGGDVAAALTRGADSIMGAATPEPAKVLTVVDRPGRLYPSAWWLLVIPPVVILLIGCLRAYRRRRADWRDAEAAAAVARDAAAQATRRAKTARARPASLPRAIESEVEVEPMDGYRRWRPAGSTEQASHTYLNDRLVSTHRTSVGPQSTIRGPLPGPAAAPAPAAPPVYVPPVYEAPRRREDDTSSSSSFSSSDWGSSPSSSSSSDSSSSSSGYDSGGGGFGGGGSDSSY